MDSNPPVPDYELQETQELTSAEQVRAIAHPLRTAILGLLHERAASVTELATAVNRPKSTVAYHVEMLQRAGLVRVVHTRRVRAVEERYYGRTARMFYAGVGHRSRDGVLPLDFNDFDVAAAESQNAYQAHELRSFIRHARIAPGDVAEFWRRAMALVHDFDRLPRSGTLAHGFAIGVYPIPEYPVLAEAEADPDRQP